MADGSDALCLTASAALLLYGSSGRVSSGGQRDGQALLVVGGGALLLTIVRLGVKTLSKAGGASTGPTFPTISILRHLWRERLRFDHYPHTASPSAALRWRRVEQGNIHEHGERNRTYEDDLRQRLHEITLHHQLTEAVAAKRGVSPEEVLICSHALDLLVTAFCLSPEQPSGAVMVKLPSHGAYESVANAVEVIELPPGDFDRAEFDSLICDRVRLIFLGSPSSAGSLPLSPELIKAYALNAPDSLVVVNEMMCDHGQHGYRSACSVIRDVPNVCVFQKAESGLPFDVLIGKENVIQTVRDVMNSTKSDITNIDIIITTKNHVSPSAESLMQFDSETGMMHRKVVSAHTPPRHQKSSSMLGLEALHHSLQQRPKASIGATAAGLMNKYL